MSSSLAQSFVAPCLSDVQALPLLAGTATNAPHNTESMCTVPLVSHNHDNSSVMQILAQTMEPAYLWCDKLNQTPIIFLQLDPVPLMKLKEVLSSESSPLDLADVCS